MATGARMRKRLRVLLFLMIILLLALQASRLRSTAFLNLAVARQWANRSCSVVPNSCASSQSESGSIQSSSEPVAGGVFNSLLIPWINPEDRQPALYQAESLFYSGKHKQAADLLAAQGGLMQPDLSGAFSGQIPAQPSPLLSIGRYEYYIVSGYRELSLGHWANAVKAFRLGLAHEGEQPSPEDMQAFFIASAYWHLETGDTPSYQRVLAGKYFVLSEEWPKATQVLNPPVNSPELSREERAWAALYRARAYAGEGLWDEAILDLKYGWQVTPLVRENGIRLWQMLVRSGKASDANRIQKQLLELGPRYRAGRYAVGYEYPSTTIVPSGWKFVGYDLDPESIGHSTSLEVWIWWERAGDAVPHSHGSDDQIEIGPYLLDRQWLTNLIPNAGFEWGESADGTPIGWSERIYSDSSSSLFVDRSERDSRTSRVAVGANAVADSSGLVGLQFPVQPNAWYLMAGWMNTSQATNSNIGRTCGGKSFNARGPAFFPWQPAIPDGTWVQIADAVPAFPDDRPEYCRLILINYMNPRGKTIWDDLIFARVRLPD